MGYGASDGFIVTPKLVMETATNRSPPRILGASLADAHDRFLTSDKPTLFVESLPARKPEAEITFRPASCTALYASWQGRAKSITV